MDLSHDELAGIVDLFGGLTEPEAVQAVEEFGFRVGEDVDATAVRAQIEMARSEFALLSVEYEGAELLVPGPTAFPTLPEGAEDLPHVLDVSRRTVPQETLEVAVRKQLARAVLEGPQIERANELIDITYDAEAWAGIDLSDVRARLEDLVAGPG